MPVPPRPQIYRDVVPQTVVQDVRPSILRTIPTVRFYIYVRLEASRGIFVNFSKLLEYRMLISDIKTIEFKN